MLTLFTGLWHIVFPNQTGKRRISWRYLTAFIIVPAVSGVGWWYVDSTYAGVSLHDSGVIAASFGVLGGLLFAHAIFVFQLRVSYDAALAQQAGPDAPIVDGRVRGLIDEMFVGVLYASLGALALTLVTTATATVIPASDSVPPILAGIIVAMAAHLAGSVVYVINATTTAYRQLQSEHR